MPSPAFSDPKHDPAVLFLAVLARCLWRIKPHARETRFTHRTQSGITTGDIAMQPALKYLLTLLLLLSPACLAQPRTPARTAPIDLPGQRPDGSVLLPNLWSLRPVGKQVLVGDFPVGDAETAPVFTP